IDEIENIEGLENFRETVNEGVTDILVDMLTRATSALPSIVIGVIKRTPRAFVACIVTLLSAFYFGMDFGGIRDGLIELLPERLGELVKESGGIFVKVIRRYGRAYLLIMLLTFVEVFVGLIVLGVDYALLIAVLVAIVDILPVLGAGTVLLPWAVVSLLIKNYQIGVGLLVLYGVITIVRQIAEPRIVGDSLGIHPIATLVAMFAGLSLFGVAGMLIGPFILMMIKEIFEVSRR
ncbi:MAG: sporulation integral membrane protein YtvI, partial [Clostridia bacterium]|nr:sporulation integral membrane protein YtvI [Clostridia bacterium]